MKICEGCIKQDVCKFKKEIDEWEKKGFFYGNKNVPKPLKVNIICELKRVESPTTSGDSTTYYPEYWTPTVISYPAIWTGGTWTTSNPWETSTLSSMS